MPATTGVSKTGDAYVDGMMVGTKWAVTSFTYSFPTSASYYGVSTWLNPHPYSNNDEPNSQFEALNPTQKAAVQAALGMYSAVANVTFTQVTETSTTHADLRYAMSDKPGTAWAYYPTTNAVGGDAWFNNSTGWYDNPIRGNYAFVSFVHETGHALGLKHPHETSGSFASMPADRDSLEYTVMSYRSYIGASTSTGYTNANDSFPQTLMMYDIAAVQKLYGANYNTNAGDTVYSWSPTTGQMFVNGVGQQLPVGNKIFLTIWDGGGNDTYDFSNYAAGVVVNLQPGAWSIASQTQRANLGDGHTAAGNIANALLYNDNPASLIENAIGSSAGDALVGNAANNKFTGGGGNDNIDGQGGSNTAVYAGTHLQYSEVQNGNGTWTVTDLRPGSPDGTDTLANIQFLQFSDGTFAPSATGGTPNRAPVATADGYAATAGVALTVLAASGVLANDSDPDGNPITAALVTGPAHGSLNLAADGSFTYTATGGYTGPDSFTYRATDGTLNSADTTVSLTVSPPVNHAPVAQNDSYGTNIGTLLTVTAANGVLKNDSDPDGNPITAALDVDVAHGSLSLAVDGSFTYTPTAGYTGSDSFTYHASDGSLSSPTVTVSLSVAQPNRAPVATNDGYSTGAGVQLTVNAASGVLSNDSDPDGNPITAALVTGPAHGSLSLASNGSFTYTPTAGYNGPDSFTYRASDGSLNSPNATVSLTVTPPPNRAPVAQADSFSTKAGTALAVTAANGVLKNDSDPDGNPITAALDTNVAHGTLNLAADGSFTYTPTAGYTGADSFTYHATDGSLGSAVTTVSLTVQPPNSPPNAGNDEYAVASGFNAKLTVNAANGLLSNDSDPDGNPMTVSLVQGPSSGTLQLAADGSFTYTPPSLLSGSRAVTFTYRASDGVSQSVVATVTIDVTTAFSPAPVIDKSIIVQNDVYAGVGGQALTVDAAHGVLANDTDREGEALTASLVTGPANGSLSFASNGSFVFTPAANFTGTTSFTYRVSDGNGVSTNGTATITVSPPSAAGLAAADGAGAPLAPADAASTAVALADGAPAPAATGLLDQSFPNGFFPNGSEHQFDFDALLALLAPKAPENGLDALLALLAPKAPGIDLGAFPFSLLAHLVHGEDDASFAPPDNMPAPAPAGAEAPPADPLHHLPHSDGLWT